jgi:hypothetical protein
MEQNAFVCWVEHPSPWQVEASVFRALSLPLNLQDNDHHQFKIELGRLRKDAKSSARLERIAREDNQQRRM